MKTKTSTILIVGGVALCFIMLFGSVWMNYDLMGIVEKSTEYIKAETARVKQEGYALDGQLEDTIREVKELIEAGPLKRDKVIEVIKAAYIRQIKEESTSDNCYCLKCHGGAR